MATSTPHFATLATSRATRCRTCVSIPPSPSPSERLGTVFGEVFAKVCPGGVQNLLSALAAAVVAQVAVLRITVNRECTLNTRVADRSAGEREDSVAVYILQLMAIQVAAGGHTPQRDAGTRGGPPLRAVRSASGGNVMS
eukprot:scaffold751_cov395-Prasinococcus_capsulatus_cf.AAC.23